MYTALTSDITDPSNSERRLLVASRKQSHISQQWTAHKDDDYTYTGIELSSLPTSTLSNAANLRPTSRKGRFWYDTKAELRVVQWAHWRELFTGLILPPMFLIAILLVTIWICLPGALYRTDEVCRPDASFYYGYVA